MSNYIYGVDVGFEGDDTVYCIFKRPNWFQKHILRVKWEYKLVDTEHSPRRGRTK